jgi:Spy/CpxP family protein refolding chaperone
MVKAKAAVKAISVILVFSVCLSFVYAKDLRNGKIIPAIMHILAPPSDVESGKLSTQLKLTPEQKQEVQKLHEKYARDTRAFRERYEVKFDQLLRLMKGSSAEGRRIEAECSEFLNLERQVISSQIEYWMGLKNVLTKRQMNRLWNHIENKRIR